jgi:hypothetical protein
MAIIAYFPCRVRGCNAICPYRGENCSIELAFQYLVAITSIGFSLEV